MVCKCEELRVLQLLGADVISNEKAREMLGLSEPTDEVKTAVGQHRWFREWDTETPDPDAALKATAREVLERFFAANIHTEFSKEQAHIAATLLSGIE